MRLGGPIFQETKSIRELVTLHKQLGFGAAFTTWIEDKGAREEFVTAFREADIWLAELGAYCINILDTDPAMKQNNIDLICKRLEQADEMGVRCCVIHGGSYETDGWGTANPKNLSDEAFDETVKTIATILDRVKPQTTKLVLETESYLFPDSPESYKQILDAVDDARLAVHLDPINITCSPRRVYFNDDFLRECFTVLGPKIVSCHAKDFNMEPSWTTVKIDETFVGDGVLNYQIYLSEINKLSNTPTLMIEHLTENQLVKGLDYLFGEAERAGIEFEGSGERIAFEASEGGDTYFAPHL
ncbi:MAG: TIM barrel protein [Spirochaetales bacterium]|nr:TIM barrel protein [Spirochaetales bacterium]